MSSNEAVANQVGNKVTKLFFSMAKIKKIFSYLDEVGYDYCSSSAQEELLKATMDHPQAEKFPPSRKYRLHFLKMLMSKVEDSGGELTEDTYSLYTSLLVTSEAENFCYCTYFIGPEAITMLESTAFVTQSTTGLKTWEAAKCLAEWAYQNTELLKEKNVVELGCGVGLTGLLVCKFCNPKQYTFTDYHPDVLQNLQKNLDLNISDWKKREEIAVQLLDWESATRDELRRLNVDVILAADVTYEPSLIQPLVNVLSNLLNPGGGVPCAYFACTVRNPATIEYFLDEVVTQGLRSRQLEGPPNSLFEYNKDCNINIYKIEGNREKK